jgi:hypothetical protein
VGHRFFESHFAEDSSFFTDKKRGAIPATPDNTQGSRASGRLEKMKRQKAGLETEDGVAEEEAEEETEEEA